MYRRDRYAGPDRRPAYPKPPPPVLGKPESSDPPYVFFWTRIACDYFFFVEEALRCYIRSSMVRKKCLAFFGD